MAVNEDSQCNVNPHILPDRLDQGLVSDNLVESSSNLNNELCVGKPTATISLNHSPSVSVVPESPTRSEGRIPNFDNLGANRSWNDSSQSDNSVTEVDEEILVENTKGAKEENFRSEGGRVNQ